MNKLQLPQAKLLWAVSQAYRQRKIDETQKRLLKGMWFFIMFFLERIITDNVEVFQILEHAENQTALIEKLVGLVRVPEAPHEVSKQDQQIIKTT